MQHSKPKIDTKLANPPPPGLLYEVNAVLPFSCNLATFIAAKEGSILERTGYV